MSRTGRKIGIQWLDETVRTAGLVTGARVQFRDADGVIGEAVIDSIEDTETADEIVARMRAADAD